MLRVLTTRPWAARTVAGVVLVTACVLLGMWQLDRADQRATRNAVIETNNARPPAPIESVLRTGGVAAEDEWAPVDAIGRYDEANQLVLRLRPVEGASGVHVLTPLVTSAGTAVLVDRGFVPATGLETPELPAPPPGEVTVLGRLRPSETGRGTGGDVSSGGVRYVELAEIGASLPYPLYGGWLMLISEDPQPVDALVPLPGPAIESGPHLSYAIQWFLFATVGVGGSVLLLRAEAAARRSDAEAGRGGAPVDATSDAATR